jgi:protein-disulfide isomerase
LAAGAALIVIAGAAWYALAPHSPNATSIPGVGEARAAADLSTLNEPPAIGERALGQAAAPVTVIEYASATCPHCAQFHKDTFPALKRDYVDTGKVRFIFREFPFDDLALAAFMVARCAPEDKYFPMIDVLFEQQDTWTRTNPKEELFKIAQLAGFTRDSFETCLKNEAIAKGVIDIRDKADQSYGVDSTPTFFINGKILKGSQPLDEFKKLIDAAASG